MTRTLKTLLLALIAALALYVAYGMWKKSGPSTDKPSTDANGLVSPSPFEGMGIRYDGHYRHEAGGLRYLLRFYPEGRVVTVNGTKEVEATLPKFLTRDTQGNPSMGLYNVPVEVRSDSLFFITRPMKGEISYRGKVTSDRTVRFIRYSHINGKTFDFVYTFRSDEEEAQLQQQAAEVGEVGDTVSGQ
ncbi:MAG: hypothetical protein IPM46_13415 [Flavobacteriales bacterium]|nr:hypothetical protein [Flavobacteriales bacterium]